MRPYARWQPGNPFLATCASRAAGMRRAGRLARAMILHALASGFRLRCRHDGDGCHCRNSCSPGDERRRREGKRGDCQGGGSQVRRTERHGGSPLDSSAPDSSHANSDTAGMVRVRRATANVAMIAHLRPPGFRLRCRHDGDGCDSRDGCSPGDERRWREGKRGGSECDRTQDRRQM
jgi:hypothetical protein